MAEWNFDISKAPKGGEKLILATRCGKVTISTWLPREKRWMMLHNGEKPVAWLPYPKHPTMPEKSDA